MFKPSIQKTVRSILLAAIICLGAQGSGFSQASTSQVFDDFTREGQKKLQLFSIIPFQYEGITENSSMIFGSRLSVSLKKYDRFDAISPEQILEYLRDVRADLLDCQEVDCGIEIARMLETTYFIVSKLSLNNGFFTMTNEVRLAVNGETVFHDQTQFPKDDIYKALDNLVSRINGHIPIEGLVIGADTRRVLIKLGAEDGLKVGDRVVLTKRDDINKFLSVPESESDRVTTVDVANSSVTKRNQRLETTESIIRITRTEPNLSEGLVVLTIDPELPAQTNYIARIYSNPLRHVKHLELARQEIDTYYGWQPKETEKQEPLTEEAPVIVPIPLPIYERNEWIRKVRHWEGEKEKFRWLFVGSAILTGIAAYTYFNDGSKNTPLLLIPIAIMGYFGYASLYSREEHKKLVDEGKYKRYINITGDSYYMPPPTMDLEENQGTQYQLALFQYSF